MEDGKPKTKEPAMNEAKGTHNGMPGMAHIKHEFLLFNHKPTVDTEYVSDKVKRQLEEGQPAGQMGDEPPAKKMKLKGRNKKRPKVNKKMAASEKLCPCVTQERECKFGDRCKFSHDKDLFFKKKLADIGDTCYLYDMYGKCAFGITCRFAKSHISETFENLSKDSFTCDKERSQRTTNLLKKDIQVDLWKKRYDFSKSDKAVEDIGPEQNQQSNNGKQNKAASENANTESSCTTKDETADVVKEEITDRSAGGGIEVDSEGIIKLRPQEKKIINFSNKLYLAPLTTVGNLPFRRICKEYGADITCSEMAVSYNLLQGQQSEWALLKRHESEDLFGVQLCGAHPDSMTRCAQLLCETMDLDFIDINCGCPIDLIFNRGEGSALMNRLTKFERIIKGMKAVMDVPLTVKIRTGIYNDKNTAHTLVPRLRDCGVALTTIHGRSRVQRYTKSADWDYINEVAKAASPMPLFGNGDILSFEEANEKREQTGVSGIMLARGALIKPWLFTEIKEQRHWDISSHERYEMLKKYRNYGLDHWGSDTQGVENTRRFLLEWLSFLYRYIPVGVLERVPQRINERPPYYTGRDEMETLMASPNCGDWVKISEMLLGPVPEAFTFLPKHKANAYK